MPDYVDWCPRHQKPIRDEHHEIMAQLYERYGFLNMSSVSLSLCLCNCDRISSFDRKYLEDMKSIMDLEVRERERLIERQKFSRTVGVMGHPPSPADVVGRWYMITFTQPDTDKNPTDLLLRTMKVIKSKMVSPVQWCYSLELTEKGTPHTHIRLWTEKYFDYKKVGAFNKGYRFDIQPEKFATGNYVIKEESKPTNEWLASHGLSQYFWCSDNYSGPKINSPA